MIVSEIAEPRGIPRPLLKRGVQAEDRLHREHAKTRMRKTSGRVNPIREVCVMGESGRGRADSNIQVDMSVACVNDDDG